MAAVIPSPGFRNATDGGLAPIRQKHLQSVDVIGPGFAFGKEAGSKFAEGHLRCWLADTVALQVEFLLEALLHEFGLPAVSGPGRLCMPDAVDIDVRPIHAPTLPERHP